MWAAPKCWKWGKVFHDLPLLYKRGTFIRMKMIKVLVLFITANISCIAPALSQPTKSLLAMTVLFDPEMVLIGGKPTVYYELHLTSQTSDSLFLQKLDVFTADGALVMSVDKNELAKKYGRKKEIQIEQQCLLLPGATGIIYMEVILPGNKPVGLKHRLVYETLHKHTTRPGSVAGAVISDVQQTPVIVGPPVGGGAWAAVYDPSWERGHRRVVYTPDGKQRIPGRFAIDFILLDTLGRSAAGDKNEIKNWYGYGVPIIAVADGVVASTRDDFPESATLSGHPAYPSDKATGNYISIDIGNGRIVFYEHLKPGSITVKAGQAVRKGDVIAALGFTGQTTGPHLHFHIANANSPLGAEGIPFAFKRFTLLGSYPDFSKFGKAPWTPVSPTIITGERPAPNNVIRFER